jgi:hypothetical protein
VTLTHGVAPLGGIGGHYWGPVADWYYGDDQRRRSTTVEPRTTLASGELYTALPNALAVGPPWLFPSLVLALFVPTVLTHRTGKHRLNAILGLVVIGLLTASLMMSLMLLFAALPAHKERPTALLVSAAALWAANILVYGALL